MNYSLVSGSDKNLAHAHYFSQDILVVSTEGLLSIQYFESEQRMVGTFNFKGNFGGKEYILSEGKFDLQDITRTSTADTASAARVFSLNLKEVFIMSSSPTRLKSPFKKTRKHLQWLPIRESGN